MGQNWRYTPRPSIRKLVPRTCRLCGVEKELRRFAKVSNERQYLCITCKEYLMLKDGCAICGGVDTDRQLSIDHCHKTLNIRGLLCRACNTAIGLLKDDINLVGKAFLYLLEQEDDT